MKKRFLFSLILVFIFLTSPFFVSPVYSQLPQEIRGVWVATVFNIDFPSKSGLDADTLKRELDDIVATVADAGLNAIFIQVRPTCDALYKSKIFPTSKWLVKQPGEELPNGFDPLAYLISIAKPRGIAIHAWINPLRITNTSGTLATQVAQNSPAMQHPDWAVEFNGKHYFDAGLPEVRELIANGVKEIVQNYDVAGIAFDDYFYPEPVKNMKFDDDKTFATYGAGFANRGDWRRDNINRLIKQCYETVKSVRSNCLFGVSPFGIWQNKAEHPQGSDTKGRNSYRVFYCDALAWMKGGYVDYISPQIYWQFTQKNARYDTLCRWWNAQCEATGIPLVVSHATYRVAEWQSAQEIAKQVVFARQLRQYGGSIFYSYRDLKKNTLHIRDVIRKIMQQNFTRPVTYNNDFTINTPLDGLVTTNDGVFIMGRSNLDSPLFLSDLPISRTKSGFFSVYKPLALGNNALQFQQGDKVVVKNVFRQVKKVVTNKKTQSVTVSKVAQPSVALPQKISISVEVIQETRLRPSPNSSLHDDFLPALRGTKDLAIEENKNQYRLRMGGFVAKVDVRKINETVPISNLRGVTLVNTDGWTNIQLTRDVEAPIDAKVVGNEFVIILFNTRTALTELKLPSNPLFNSAKIVQVNNKVKLHFELKNTKNFYGFTAQKAEKAIEISVRNPSALVQGDKPLLGKTVILDAGHGGKDSGARGPAEAQNEEHLNLNFVMCLKNKLENLGAKIILTRDKDTTVKLLERENFVRKQSPDLSISIHHNSIVSQETGGFLALYKNPAGKWLAETITRRIGNDTFTRCAPVRSRRLAMCRFRAFPSVLLELGYLTCPEDVERANNDAEMNNICTAIADAVLDFYKGQEAFINSFTQGNQF